MMAYSMAGIVLALLLLLGMGAMWLGRNVLVQLGSPAREQDFSLNLKFLLTNRAVAMWAAICLIVVAPVSVVTLGWLLR